MDGASRKWDDPTTGSIALLEHDRQVATLLHKPCSILGLLAPAVRYGQGRRRQGTLT